MEPSEFIIPHEKYPQSLRTVALLLRSSVIMFIPLVSVGIVTSPSWQLNWSLNPASLLMGISLGSSLLYCLSIFILKRKNWARFVYLGLCILGLISIGNVAKAFHENILFGLLQLSQSVMQFYAGYLLTFDKSTTQHFKMAVASESQKVNEVETPHSGEVRLMSLTNEEKSTTQTDLLPDKKDKQSQVK